MATARHLRVIRPILLAIAVCFVSFPTHAKYSGGMGEPNDPYQIATAEDLILLGDDSEDYDKHFIMTADIDMNPDLPGRKVFDRAVIGVNWETPFTGVFDGNSHIILNFSNISAETNDIGLFGYVCGENAKIQDLGLIDPHIAGKNSIGSLVADLENGIITGCYIEGGSVSGHWDVGGLVGSNGGIITDCRSTASVTGAASVGGLVGWSYEGSTISNCCATGSVHASSILGGLVGGIGPILIGFSGPVIITNCCATGDVSGTDHVGGLLGWDFWDGLITNCYATGNVEGETKVGGLVGEHGSLDTIVHCYATGSVSGSLDVGGLIGRNGGRVVECYSTGAVNGNDNVGGLMGYSYSSVSATGSFWDIETSGQATSAGGEGKTTAELQDPRTFMEVGWDFVGQPDGPHDIWAEPQEEGYPILWWQLSPLPELPFSGGTGGPTDPYLISTPIELNSIGHNPRLMGAHFRLMNDIHLTDIDFFVIGSYIFPFTGVFDGNGNNISHFSHTSTDTYYIGLFNYVKGENAEIRSLGLIDPNIDARTGDNVGSLVGCLSGGTITGCYVQGGSVSGDSGIGGLVGSNWDGLITNCHVDGGSVLGDRSVGGLAGGCSGIITDCYSNNCVSGNDTIGGLVGWNGDAITNCYATGSVEGGTEVGGLVGDNYRRGKVSNCYATGRVSGNDNVGGLVGTNTNYWGNEGVVVKSFWDTQTSGQATSAGGEGKTTAEMQTVSTFLEAGWDFVHETVNGTEDIWWILEDQSYPRLWWQYGQAFFPYPHDGAVNVTQSLLLSWLPGGFGLYHDVYFGEDEEAAADATTESTEVYCGRQSAEMTTFDPGPLKWDTTYYWRIDEVNAANARSPWAGKVWNFTMVDYILVFVVDDFERYTYHDTADDIHIWKVWIDGYDNGTGSQVGYMMPPFCERRIVHGGHKSMPLFYDNDGTVYEGSDFERQALVYSETVRTFDRFWDWTINDADTLTLYFRGEADNDPETLYVGVEDRAGRMAVATHPDADALLTTEWQKWHVSLEDMQAVGVDLTTVLKIYIGVGNRDNPQPGGAGKIYIDDIWITRRMP